MIDVATIKAGLACDRARCTCTTNGNTHCPAHDDRTPSLSVKRGDKVPVIFTCHGGCTQEEVLTALRERGLWLMPQPAHVNTNGIPHENAHENGRATWRIVNEWAYPNDGSPPLAIHGREEDGSITPKGKPRKRNRWRLPDGTYDAGLGGLKLSALPLYNAHLLDEHPDRGGVLVEGERAADAAVANGLIAVSLPGGAAQTDFGDALEPLRERLLYLWPDANDEPGAALIRRVREQLPHAKLVTLPDDLEPGDDAVEYFAKGYQPEALFMPRLRSKPIAEFVADAGERKPDVVSDIVGAGANWLFGGPGATKTATAFEVAGTKATGRSNVGWTATPGRVLVVGVDMANVDYSQYAIDILGDRLDEAGDNLRIWRPDDGLHLDDPNDAQMLMDEIDGYKPELVILDHMGLMITGDGFSPSDLQLALDPLGRIRQRGIALLVVDETRKESNQGNARPPAIDQLFGGRRKASFADRAWGARRDEASGVVTLTPAKQRGSAVMPISLRFGSEGMERVEGAEISNTTPAESKVLACIAAAPIGLPRTRTDIQQATGLSTRFVKDALGRLQYLNEIIHDGYRGRAKTYKCASVQKCATEGAV